MKIHEITSDMRSDLLSLRPLHITAVTCNAGRHEQTQY